MLLAINMAAKELNTEKYENLKKQVEQLGLEQKQKNKLLVDDGAIFLLFLFLFAISILHSRESDVSLCFGR